MTKKQEIAPPPMTQEQALALFEDRFGGEDLSKRLSQPSSNNITTGGKMFNFSDGRKDHGPLNVIILDWVATNSYFDGEYDPNNRVPPKCFAVGDTDNDHLTPVNESPDKQCDNCGDCPHNKFGSKGNGKACKNQFKLAMIPADLEEPDTSKVWTINVSPTGIKQYATFVRNCEKELGVQHPIRVAVDMQFDALQAYPTLQFVDAKLHGNLAVAVQLQEYAREQLMRIPNFDTK
jgi:hypothetical protein